MQIEHQKGWLIRKLYKFAADEKSEPPINDIFAYAKLRIIEQEIFSRIYRAERKSDFLELSALKSHKLMSTSELATSH